MRKRAIRKTAAAVKRAQNRQDSARVAWAKQEQRLLNLIEATYANKTMQTSEWVKGQGAYYEMLLANHREAKPR